MGEIMSKLDSGSWIRVEHDPPPIPTRECDWHAWVDGEEERGTFHGPDRYSVLLQIADALAERYFSRPATTKCECGAFKEVP
jgi:hypothetical protein